MNLTMVQFNTLFKQKMNEAKIIEKTHPREGEKTWFQLTLFMINFAKSPNCPRKLRKQLIYQADTIVKKIKLIRAGMIRSVVDSKISAEELDRMVNSIPTATTTSLDNTLGSSPEITAASVENLDEDSVISQLQSFPDVPDDLAQNGDDGDDSSGGGDGGGDIPFSNPPSDPSQDGPVNPFFMDKSPSDSDSTQQPSGFPTSGSPPPTDQDMQKLSSLEEELKKMPDIMKEVKPAPFSTDSIINPGSTPGDSPDLTMFNKDTTTLDFTDSSVSSNVSDSEPDLPSSSAPSSTLTVKGFTPQPFQVQDKPKDQSVADPFGPDSLNSAPELKQDEENPFCFACGGALNPGDKVCPLCGSEN
ncbi:MAG: hypothetical protein ACTSYI_01185 [Promethearchaeota archaeon]